jgi:NADH dehydrogenase/NADH:ubiquinone oxidoreductase subunit G
MQYWPDELMAKLHGSKSKKNLSLRLPDEDAATRNIIFQTAPDLSKLPFMAIGRKSWSLKSLWYGKKIKLFIDGKAYRIREGIRLLDAIRAVGIALPTLCDLPGFPFRGICRLCMVRIKGTSLPLLSCSTIAKEGMVINTCSPDLQTNRKLLMEFVLAEHGECGREDCPVENLAKKFGVKKSRFQARRLSEPDHLSSNYLKVQRGLCVHCDRCIRACPHGIIGRIHRGNRISIAFDYDNPVDKSNCIGCGDCIAVCPSGAIQHNTRIFLPESEKNAAGSSLET